MAQAITFRAFGDTKSSWSASSDLLQGVRPRDGNAVHFFSLSQSMSERPNGATAFAGPEAKHDLREINHITISKSAGALAPGKLQFDDAINLF
jgi:hypothetical protein